MASSSPLQDRVLALFRRRTRPVTSTFVAERCDISIVQACRILRRLSRSGLLVREGTRRQYMYRRAA